MDHARYACVLLWYHILLMTVDEVCDPLRWPPRLNRVARIPCHAVGVEPSEDVFFPPDDFQFDDDKDARDSLRKYTDCQKLWHKFYYWCLPFRKSLFWHELLAMHLQFNLVTVNVFLFQWFTIWWWQKNSKDSLIK